MCRWRQRLEWYFYKPAVAAAAAKLLQSCLTLCDPIDGSPPGSAVPGILQARTLECVAISFSNTGKWKVKVKSLSRVWLFATPWTAAYQAPPSVGFSRQEYWNGVPLPSTNLEIPNTACKSSEATKDTWHSFFLGALKRNSVDPLEFLATCLSNSSCYFVTEAN